MTAPTKGIRSLRAEQTARQCRFGPLKPVYVLTSSATFSGGEQVSYGFQQLARATIIGERTKAAPTPAKSSACTLI
jgi:C-terminal processing protease CtpA/Prc